MTGPHRVHAARPAQLGFQSFGLGCPVAKRTGVPASPQLGAQALPAAPSQAPSHGHARHPWFSSCCWLLFSHFTDWNAGPRKHARQASGISNWHSRLSSRSF